MSVRGLLTMTGLFAGAVLAGHGAEREFERTFPVEPGCTLKLDTYRGSVEIVESTSDIPEIRATLHLDIATDNEEEAERAYAALRLGAEAENNTVSFRARNPRESGVRFIWNDRQPMALAWRIAVPRKCNLEVVTRSGGITVGNLTGAIVARTEGGSIGLKRIDGSVDASAQQGDVILSRCTGPVKIRVLGGILRTGTLDGVADLKNINGDIEVLAARAGISASTEAGDIQVGFPRDLTGDARISTSGGSIRVTIDPAANCTVNASSVWGHVETSLPLTVESGGNKKSKLVGHLGQAGVDLTLHANGGHVRISSGETFFE